MWATGPRTETDLCNLFARKEIRRSGPRDRAEVDGVVGSASDSGTIDMFDLLAHLGLVCMAQMAYWAQDPVGIDLGSGRLARGVGNMLKREGGGS